MDHRIPASCRVFFYAPKLTQDGKKMPFFPLCHFVFLVSCVGVMTPFSRKNTSRLFSLWSSEALEFGFWKLQMKKVRIRADLIEKELFSLSSLSSRNLFFPFSLKLAHKNKTTCPSLRWRDETLLHWVRKRSCNMCFRINYIMISLWSLILHTKVKKHYSKTLDCPAFCIA